MTSLLDIPVELIREIISLMDGKDLKELRYTCSKLSNIASAYQFKNLYLSCHGPDLEAFRHIAARPVLLGGVHTLIIDDTTISPILMDENVFRAMSRRENMWPKRKLPYFSNDNWDHEGRVWSTEADRECFELLKVVYEGHETNRLEQRDVAALWDALPGMTGLRTLVLTNRTIDDTPDDGAQSRFNSSPVAKMWRGLGEARQERLPFPPRVDWYHALEDDDFESDEPFEMDYILDSLDTYLGPDGRDNGDHGHEDGSAIFSEDDPAERSDDAEDSGHSVAITDSIQAGEIVPSDDRPVLPHNVFIPAAVRALRRESRGLRIVTEILRHESVQSRLTGFRIDASLDTLSDVQTPGLSMRLFDFLAPPFCLRISLAFSVMCMTKFKLVLSSGRDQERGQEIIEQGQVGTILAAMPRLRHLSIEAHGMGVIGAIPNDTTFPDLRSAEFACGLISRHEIRRFLRHHGTTLQHFRILFCSLDDEMPSWSDAVQDIMRLQAMGKTKLRTAVLRSGYESIPFTGCGWNRTKTRPEPDEGVYSWALGIHEDVIDCPIEELGHEALPEPVTP